MAYILCDIHGGNIASLVSPEISRQIVDKKGSVSAGQQIQYKDEAGNLFSYLVDDNFLKSKEKELQVNLSSVVTDEDIIFQIELELVPICPGCLRSALENAKAGLKF